MLSSPILIASVKFDLRDMDPLTVLLLSIALFLTSLPFVLLSIRTIGVGTKQSGAPFPFLRKTGRLEFALAFLGISVFLASQYLPYLPSELPSEATDLLVIAFYIFTAVWCMLVLIFIHQALLAIIHSCASSSKYGWRAAWEAESEKKCEEIV